MGSLAILSTARTLPEGGGPVVTVSTPSGVVFLEIPADGPADLDLNVLPPGLTQAAIDDLCVIAMNTRAALSVWATRHTVPTLEAGA